MSLVQPAFCWWIACNELAHMQPMACGKQAVELLEEQLAVAASSAAVEEDSFLDVLRDAIYEVDEEFTEALAPEKQVAVPLKRK